MRGAHCTVLFFVAFFAFVMAPARVVAAPTVGQAQTQGQGSISGSVRDSRGDLQSGALVSLSGPDGSTSVRTGSDGRFSFTVAPGLYTITIEKGGFQTYRSDLVAAVEGTPNDAAYTLADATSSTLQTIGGTSTRANQTPINRDITAQATLSGQELLANPTPNLDMQITDLPGITLVQGNRSTLAYFNIRGSTGIESRTEIDGHPLSTGVSGVYYTGLLNAGIFESIDLEKGPGVTAADAGESSFGTLNLRTWDFSDKFNGFAMQGIDSYNGQFTSILARGSTLKVNRLSYVLDYNVNGYNGPAFGTYGPLAAPSGNTLTPAYTVGTANTGSALVNYLGTFDAGQRLTSQVFKLRYRLSDVTSVWVGYVGSQGFVNPEGDLYGYYYGRYTVVPCFNGTTPQATLATCNQTSTYSNPALSAYFGRSIPLYSAYPGETQTENNPMFEAELRTSFRNDTILVRPFTQVVQRINDGSQAPLTAGNNGAFSLATTPSSCSATDPCYINSGGSLLTYRSPANPCASSTTPIANSCYQDGTPDPFYQYELDRLHGVTATYLHPLGSLGTLRAGYQYTSDYTYDISGYPPTPALPVQVAGFPTFSQSISDVSNVSVPGAVRRSNDFSLAGFLTPTERLSVAAGVFYNLDSLAFSYENPAILALAPYVPGGTSNLPLDLIDATINKSHVDPHAGLVYNASRTIAARVSAGSSVTLPYAQQVSGFPTFSQPTTTYPYGYYTEKNPGLRPETVVSYDAGLDLRLRDGGVFSVDAFQNTIHNAFLTEYSFPLGIYQPAVRETINASNYQAYGLELSARKEQRRGLGYIAQLTLLRAFYYDLGPTYYRSNTGYVTTFDDRQPDGLPYATAAAGLVYNGAHDLRAEFGVNYAGNNNSYFVAPFQTFYGSLRRKVANHVDVQLSARNIFNQQNETGIAKATPFGSGISTVECKYVKSAGNPLEYVQSKCSYYTNGQQQIEPQSFALSVLFRL